MRTTNGWWVSVLSLAIAGTAAGCGSSEGAVSAGPMGGGGGELCERYASVATDVGCSFRFEECEAPTTCIGEQSNLLDCIQRHTDDCYCEPDGDVNCEGAWKQNEGSAACFDEAIALDTCEELQDDEELSRGLSCAQPGESCERNDCCDGLYCVDSTCSTLPAQCAAEGSSCDEDDCCPGLYCTDDGCSTEPAACAEAGDSCAEDDCCAGLTCAGAVCQ